MADYLSPTVVQPTIPNADMTALERLLLTHIFESEPDGDGLYFFAETSPNDQIELPIESLRAALASAEGVASETAAFVQGQLKDVSDDEPYVHIDLSGTSYEFILCRDQHKMKAHPGFRGDGATIASTSAVSSAFPRFLALCTNWKNAR